MFCPGSLLNTSHRSHTSVPIVALKFNKPIRYSNLRRPVRVPINGRRCSLDAVDCVRITENRQPLRARRLAGMVHLVSVEIILLHE